MSKSEAGDATKKAGRYLGIDFGSRRVGIALSDEEGKFAMPRAVLPNDRYLFGEIKNTCAAHNVKAIVMGESKDFKGNPNPIMKDIEFFKGELERELQLPVYLEPEYMTTEQAGREQGVNALIDASAAAIILQSYLDRGLRSGV
jgi:putative Holliday junction resolvase